MVLREITSVLTRFLWTGPSLLCHGSKVAWQKISRPYSEGGLNLKNLKDWNKATILLHLWNIINPSTTSLWAKWIRNTVLKDKCFWSIPIPLDCSWIWRKVLQLRDCARGHLSYSVGNGKTFNLWFDPWYKGKPLASSSCDPIILHSGLQLNATVSAILPEVAADRWRLPQSNHHSMIQLRLDFDLSTTFNLAETDKIFWESNSSVSAAFIWDTVRPKDPLVHWCPILWHRFHIPKFSFVTWLLIQNGLKTKDRLLQYGLNVDPTCVLCNRDNESVQHLYFSCSYSHHLMFRVLRQLGWKGSSSNWGDILQALLAHPGTSHKRRMAFLGFTTLVYGIWQERNARLHTSSSKSVPCLARELLHLLRSKFLGSFTLCNLSVG